MRGLAGNTVGHGKVRKKLNFYLFGLFERGNGVVKRKTPEIIAEGAGKLRTLKFATKKRQKAVKTQRFNAIKRQLDQKPRKSNFSKQFPPAAAEGSALWTPGRGAAPAPRACAASGRALPCTRWGFRPRPRDADASLLRLRAGRGTGLPHPYRSMTSPPERRRTGREGVSMGASPYTAQTHEKSLAL